MEILMPSGGLDVLLKAERGEVDPLTITADQYDLVCNGIELSSGAVRNHDPEIMGVSATGIAGPDTDGVHRVGQVFVALATADGTFVKELDLGEHRNRPYIRRASGNYVYDMVFSWFFILSFLSRGWLPQR